MTDEHVFGNLEQAETLRIRGQLKPYARIHGVFANNSLTNWPHFLSWCFNIELPISAVNGNAVKTRETENTRKIIGNSINKIQHNCLL